MIARMPDETRERPTTNDELECTRKRTLDGIHRCLALLTGAAGRDWLHCGKAACARSRRCRGFACEPAPDDEDASG